MDKSNYKLSKFFQNQEKRLTKKAAVGFFHDMMSIEDIKKNSPMLIEMIELPKYKPTIDQLKSATGFVNFVTKDGYAPLIECLLKAAFPLDRNSMFDLGDVEVTGSSFAVGASYFGTDPGGGVMGLANKKLEDLLLGSDALMTRDWLKEEKGMDDKLIEQTFGKFEDAVIEKWMEDRERYLAEQSANGLSPDRAPPFPPPQEVKDSNAPGAKIGWEMTVYEHLLSKINDKWRPVVQHLEDRIKGTAVGNDGEPLAIPSKEESAKLKSNRQMYMDMRRGEILSLKGQYQEVLGSQTVDRLTGKPTKNKDGFINAAPGKSIVYQTREVIRMLNTIGDAKVAPAAPAVRQPPRPGAPVQPAPRTISPQEKFQKAVVELRRNLESFSSRDKHLTSIISEFLKLIGHGDPEDLDRMKSKLYSTTTRLQKALSDTLLKQGRVLILDEIDKSVLFHQGRDKEGATLDKSSKYILSKFIAQNNVNAERDTAPQDFGGGRPLGNPKKEFGSRVIIGISSEPVSGLPAGSTVITLDASPVNPEEAEIIVRYKCDDFDRSRLGQLQFKRHEEVEEKFKDDPVALRAEKSKGVLSPLDKESQTPEYMRKRMASYISGLPVKDAIISVITTLKQATELDEKDPLKPQINLNKDSLMKLLRDDVNKRIQTDVLGVKLQNADVQFDEYAYNKYSEWATQVQGIGNVKTALDSIGSLIKSDKNRISEIDDIIRNGSENNRPLTDNDKKYYQAERDSLVVRISANEQDRMSMAANDIPHIYLLHGLPGVGKSVWAHALASLFDLTIIDVDITAQMDKWVGSSGKNARGLLSMMGNSKSTVFLIDEIDRQVDQGGKGKVKQEAHEVTKGIIYQFLQFFEDTGNNRLFKANQVFFIMTSNNPNSIDQAWLQRTGTGYYEVKLPEDPEDYKKFFKSYMNVEKTRFPEYPWFQDPEEIASLTRQLSNISERERTKIIQQKGWENTIKVIERDLDWDKIAIEFAGKKIDFRTLKMILQQAYSFNGFWKNSLRILSDSPNPSEELKNIKGLPLTTENILQTARIAKTAAEDNTAFTLGIVKIAVSKKKQMDEMISKYAGQKLTTEDYLDPHTAELIRRNPDMPELKKQDLIARNTKKRTIIPKEISDFMGLAEVNLEEEVDLNLPEYSDYKEEIDPETGLLKGIKTPQKKVPSTPQTPEQEMAQLEDEAFEPSEEDKQIEPTDEEGEEDEEKTKVSSSTDYYFEYLKKNGIINNKNKVIKIKKARREIPQPQNDQPSKGDLFYNGFVMVVQGPAQNNKEII